MSVADPQLTPKHNYELEAAEQRIAELEEALRIMSDRCKCGQRDRCPYCRQALALIDTETKP